MDSVHRRQQVFSLGLMQSIPAVFEIRSTLIVVAEAFAPLVALGNSPQFVAEWDVLVFIDDEAACAALARESSSVADRAHGHGGSRHLRVPSLLSVIE